MLIDDFNTLLPDEIKTEAMAALHADILTAFNLANRVPPPVLVQRVDDRNGTSFEVVDRRRPKGRRIVATFDTEEKARAEQMKRAPIGGGAYTFEAVDTDEYFHDTDYEILASRDKYGVISGCTATPDAANLTVDLAAGVVYHNGGAVAVTAATNAWTIVADGTNERWAALCVDSAGSAALVSGDAAASASVEPTKPEIGDRVLLELYKVQAAQTIAANCELQLDKRIILRGPFTVIKSAAETVNNSTTLQNDDALLFPLAASTIYAFEFFVVYRSSAVAEFKYTLTVPAGATIHWSDQGVVSAVTVDTTPYQRNFNASAAAVGGFEGAATDISVHIEGYVSNSTTTGNLQLQWAQNVGEVSDTIVRAGSWLRVSKA